MATDTTTGDLRAQVVVQKTTACMNYVRSLVAPPPGPGATQDATGSYTIPDDTLAPRPTVPVSVYYVTDDDGSETVLASERVQAVFRDGGVQRTDPTTQDAYTLFTYMVLVSLDVRTAQGQTVNCFAWSATPAGWAAGQTPIDMDAGTYGFPFDSTYTGVPL